MSKLPGLQAREQQLQRSVSPDLVSDVPGQDNSLTEKLRRLHIELDVAVLAGGRSDAPHRGRPSAAQPITTTARRSGVDHCGSGLDREAWRFAPPGSQTPSLGTRATTRAFEFHHSVLKRQWSSAIGSDEPTMASYLGQTEVPCQPCRSWPRLRKGLQATASPVADSNAARATRERHVAGDEPVVSRAKKVPHVLARLVTPRAGGAQPEHTRAGPSIVRCDRTTESHARGPGRFDRASCAMPDPRARMKSVSPNPTLSSYRARSAEPPAHRVPPLLAHRLPRRCSHDRSSGDDRAHLPVLPTSEPSLPQTSGVTSSIATSPNAGSSRDSSAER